VKTPLTIVDNGNVCEIRSDFEFKGMLEFLGAKGLVKVATNRWKSLEERRDGVRVLGNRNLQFAPQL